MDSFIHTFCGGETPADSLSMVWFFVNVCAEEEDAPLIVVRDPYEFLC